MRKLPFETAQLIYRYKIGSLTESADKKRLNEWISASSQNKALFEKLISRENIIGFSKQLSDIDIDRAWHNFLLEKQKQKNRSMHIACIKYAAMVAVVLCMSVGWYLLYISDNLSDRSSQISTTPESNQIVSGRTKATLTLQSGEQIELEKDKTLLANQVKAYAKNAEAIRETENETFSTLETPIGGEYRLILPDGSFAYLNCQTKLRFPDKFTDNKREIELLQGEIYLDINASVNKPFFVQVKGLTIRVTGTCFNISTYDNIYQTTLVKGAVEVCFDTGKTYTLKASEQLSFEPETNRIQISEVDTDQYTSWVDGRIVFKDETIENILNKLSRWYNFNVIYDHPKLRAYRFGLHVNKYDNINIILTILESTGKLRFEPNGNTIYVKKGK